MDSVHNTHWVQLAAIAAFCVLDVVVLIELNRLKQSQQSRKRLSGWSWEGRRNAYWSLIALVVSIAVGLDVFFPIDAYILPIKQYAFAFPLGLLDLYFSETGGVSLKVLVGAMLWCSTILIRQFAVDSYFGHHIPPVMVTEFGVKNLGIEMVRYVFSLIGVGLLSDLLFSPLHRLTHHPTIYKYHHKDHHEYTNKLTSLVIYHGSLLDDFMMPFTTTIGSFCYVVLLSMFGMETQAFSNVAAYLIIFNTLLSHAHDIRCARLMAPLPDSMNFVAYHYVHHLKPNYNFGLTEPSDRLWDMILGVDTIHVPSRVETKTE